MLVNFWGTWCEPCLEELPQFERLYRHYRAQGLSLVAIATDEDAQQVRAFAERSGLKTPLVYDGDDRSQLIVLGGDWERGLDPESGIGCSRHHSDPRCSRLQLHEALIARFDGSEIIDVEARQLLSSLQ